MAHVVCSSHFIVSPIGLQSVALKSLTSPSSSAVTTQESSYAQSTETTDIEVIDRRLPDEETLAQLFQVDGSAIAASRREEGNEEKQEKGV